MNLKIGGTLGDTSSGMNRTLADFFTFFIELISVIGFSVKGLFK